MQIKDFWSGGTAATPAVKAKSNKRKPCKAYDVGALLLRHNIETKPTTLSDGTIRYDLECCPFCQNKGSAVFSNADGTAGFNCFHNSCIDKTFKDYLAYYEPDAVIEHEQKHKPDDFSDAGNTEIFIREYGEEFIHCDSLGWLKWTGAFWDRDEHAALSAVMKLSKDMLKEAKEEYQAAYQASELLNMSEGITSEESTLAAARLSAASDYVSHALKTRNNARLKAVCDLSIPYLTHKADELDADAFLLNTPAGSVDLRTGILKPHNRQDYCTKITEVSPDNNGSEVWQDFLNTLTCNDEQMKTYLQYVAGMSAIGSVFYEGLLICLGSGSNGKSTYFNFIKRILGTYANSIAADTLTTRENNKGASLATLRGIRLAVCSELEEAHKLSVSILKRVASRDALTIEEKYKQPEEIRQSHTICLFTNILPHVDANDNGTWRRLTVVPFNAKFSGSSDRKDYSEVLYETCAGSALQWVIDGAKLFIEAGFTLPECDAAANATAAYRKDSDWLGQFIEDRTITELGCSCNSMTLYKAYEEWCVNTGQRYKRNIQDFGRCLKEAGFESEHRRIGTVWFGIELRNQWRS